ncbi:hypothetical protein GGI15_000723 [Coemansia interrupta]|uniref:SUN domain-containing protein n=1 Tax=Coemansia interrupta TaxID=1126814 RepID=A0A9W8LNL6_9FUNG|nr:hypothetical protein GGI15_000723 [Coemansia interrupta]
MGIRYDQDTDDRFGNGLHNAADRGRYGHTSNMAGPPPSYNPYPKQTEDEHHDQNLWETNSHRQPLGSTSGPNWLKKITEKSDTGYVDQASTRQNYRAEQLDGTGSYLRSNAGAGVVASRAPGNRQGSVYNSAGAFGNGATTGSTYGANAASVAADADFDSADRIGGRASGSIYGNNPESHARGLSGTTHGGGNRYGSSVAGTQRQSLYAPQNQPQALSTNFSHADPYNRMGDDGPATNHNSLFAKPARTSNYASNPYGEPSFAEGGEADMDLDLDFSPVPRPRPRSSMSQYQSRLPMTTPRRLSFEAVPGFGNGTGNGNGVSTVKKSLRTPYTARIKGPGAFPATAQRFSQRKKMNGASDDEAASPTATRNGAASRSGDLLGAHRYLNTGPTASSHRGWGEYGPSATASALGVGNVGASVRTFSDSFISNSSDTADASHDNPTLLRRLLRNICAGWGDSRKSRVAFVLMVLYFVVKETLAFMATIALSLLVGAVRSPVRMLVALAVVGVAATLASQHARPFSLDIGSFIKGRLFPFSFFSPSRSDPGMRPVPLSSEEIVQLGGTGSVVVERLQQIDHSISQLYAVVDALKLHHNDDASEVRDSLQRLQAERLALVDSARGDKQRIDQLEREYARFKHEMDRALGDAAGAREMQKLKQRVDTLDKKAAGSGGGGGFLGMGSKGLSASAVRKIVNDEIRVQRDKLRSLHDPEWLTSDGDSAMASVAHMIDSALARFAKDRLAKTDFALLSAGARVIPGLTSPTFEPAVRGVGQWLWRAAGYISSMPPSTALDPATHIGECWPMQGSSGQIAVHLASPVDITEFALEHLPKSMAIDWRSAPRSVEVWGYVIPPENSDGGSGDRDMPAKPPTAEATATADRISSDDQHSSIASDDYLSGAKSLPTSVISNPPFAASRSGSARGKLTLLATHEYQPSDNQPVQIISTFPRIDGQNSDGTIRARTIIFKVNSNWGHPDHTCIYRFRVHGLQPSA